MTTATQITKVRTNTLDIRYEESSAADHCSVILLHGLIPTISMDGACAGLDVPAQGPSDDSHFFLEHTIKESFLKLDTFCRMNRHLQLCLFWI